MPIDFSGQRIYAENVSPSFPADAWLACGLPEPTPPTNLVATDGNGAETPAYVRGQELFIRLALEPGELRELELRPAAPGEITPENYTASPWVVGDPADLAPRFFLQFNGNRVESNIPTIVSHYDAMPCRLRVEFWSQFTHLALHVHGWFSIYSDQEVVEFDITSHYGTNRDQPRDRFLGSLSMVIGEKPHLDHRTAKGLHYPIWRPDLAGYEAELANPSVDWMRCRTVRNLGALLCLPSKTSTEDISQHPRALNLQHRQEARPRLLYGGWDGSYGAFGVVPTLAEPHKADERKTFYTLCHHRLNTPGSEDAPRLWAQPPSTGTTGRQEDFGAAKGHQAVSYNEPRALHFLDFDLDAWFRRPFRNREISGLPCQARDHEDTTTYTLIPDHRHTAAAHMLGWPHPATNYTGYSGSDAYHRSDNLLHAAFALERSPAIAEVIEDMLELDQMDYWRHQPPPNIGCGTGSPRGWGRPMLSWAHAVRNGFAAGETLLCDAITRVHRSAAYQATPNAAIKVLSRAEFKYGWLEQEAPHAQIHGWSPWKESIAVMGLFAAYRQLPVCAEAEQAREMCVIVSKTIARHAFYLHGGRYHCPFMVRWVEDGYALPASAYTPWQPNYDVYTYDAMSEWTLPALRILLQLEPNCDEATIAQSILDSYGPPTTWQQACWLAVT